MELTKIMLLFLTISIKLVRLSKILVPFPSVAQSHFIGLQSILYELANRGHEVTVINSFADENFEQTNYRHIKTNNIDRNLMSKIFVESSGNILVLFKNFNVLFDLYSKENEAFITHPEVVNLLENESFDLVITEAFFGGPFLGFAAHFNCPSIAYSSFKATNYVNYITGNPQSLSSVSNIFLSLEEPMSFYDRVLNFLWYSLDMGIITRISDRQIKLFYEKNFPASKYPTMDSMVKNISLVLLNHHFSQGNVRPYVPGLIEIGGTQMINSTQKLNDDLQKWMDDSENGVIYFSMGTVIQGATISEEKLNIFISSFSKLKENILWKFEEEKLILNKLTKNVRVNKWLPQRDILAHPKLKLFISHGGLGSITEALYYGKPMLIISVFGDQSGNGDTVSNQRWGLKIKYFELTEQKFIDAIDELLTNKLYKETVIKRSILYRDRPLSSIDTAIYWIEYVIRHRGAKHLQTFALNMNFFEYHSLDVMGILIFINSFCLFIFVKIIKLICKQKTKVLKKYNKNN